MTHLQHLAAANVPNGQAILSVQRQQSVRAGGMGADTGHRRGGSRWSQSEYFLAAIDVPRPQMSVAVSGKQLTAPDARHSCSQREHPVNTKSMFLHVVTGESVFTFHKGLEAAAPHTAMSHNFKFRSSDPVTNRELNVDPATHLIAS